jgi:hypothetical protein
VWSREKNRDEGQDDHSQAGPNDHRLPVVPVVDPHDDRHEAKSDERPGGLLEQEEIRLLVLVHGEDSRRAVDHHDARTHEQQGGREEQLVGFELSRHTPQTKGLAGSHRQVT